jgi:hypothetical protein
LAPWSPFITKISLIQDLAEKWTASTSLIYYGGFPGGSDYANWNDNQASPSFSLPLTDPGNTTAFGANVYWNVGLEYRLSKKLTLRADGYNLAGLFDQTLNKRNYIFREGAYSIEPVSCGISVAYRF